VGWGSGSAVAADLWSKLEKIVPKELHQQVAIAIVQTFEDHDCDTMYETTVGEVSKLFED
jgi:hypothetical protein